MLNDRGSSDIDSRIAVETLRYFQKNDEESFEELREDLEGTELWKRFEREYGS
jgi:hypothetical protein